MTAIDTSLFNRTTTPTAASPTGTLGQAEFLKLLTTQLTNQSPLNPMDNEQFVAQMAQFSTVSGIAEMNQSLKSIGERIGGNPMSEAAAYIGKQALVPASEVTPGENGVSGAVELAEDVEALAVHILDSAGTTVRTLQLGPQEAGSVEFSWDGKNADGDTAENGPFFIAAAGVRNGLTAEAPLYVTGRIESVSMGADGVSLKVAGVGAVAPSAVRRLS